MNAIYRYFITAVFILSFFTEVNCQIDTCWTMYFPDEPANGYYNPDSVLYDSCYCKDRINYGCDSIYAKQWFEIIFYNKDPFGFPSFPEDTIIETTWQELDSSYIDLRNMFQGLENIYGLFILRKDHPNNIDPTSSGSRNYLIRFQNYVNIIKVLKYFHDSQLLDSYDYRNRCIWIRDYINDDDILLNNIALYPNPCNNFLKINFSSDIFNSINLRIIDIFGENQFTLKNFIILSNNQNIQIKTDVLPEGIYFCIIDAGKYRFIKKFIKVN